MSNQQTADNTLRLSEFVGPPRPFEDEPTIIIFDLNEYIVDRPIDLKPFNRIVTIINDQNILIDTLRNPNKSFSIVFIFPQWNNINVQTFVNHNVVIYPSVRNFYLFFINGQQINFMPGFGPTLIQSYSITSRTMAETRNACARINDDNINYCELNRIINEYRHEIGQANAYVMQKYQRLRLQSEYNQLIEREIEQRFFDN